MKTDGARHSFLRYVSRDPSGAADTQGPAQTKARRPDQGRPARADRIANAAVVDALSTGPSRGARAAKNAGLTLDTAGDHQSDGHIIGARGQAFPPGTPLSDVPPVTPRNGVPAEGTVVLINGIMNDVALHHADMQALADTGLNVVGVHNATKGMFRDVAQCIGEKLGLDLARSTAVESTADLMYDAVMRDEPLHFVGHSQGALIASRALVEVKNRLIVEDGRSEAEVEEKLGGIKVETLGGAATRFVDGPEYVHHVNRMDFIPMLTGVGPFNMNPLSNPGEGAVIRMHSKVGELHTLPNLKDSVTTFFARMTDRLVHGTQDVYFGLRGLSPK